MLVVFGGVQYVGWRGVRVAEGARLESVCACNRTAGSNPALSAIFISIHYVCLCFVYIIDSCNLNLQVSSISSCWRSMLPVQP